MAASRFKATCKTAIVTVAGQALRIVWTSSGIAAVERETLSAKSALERRTKMKLANARAPSAVRHVLALAAKGKADDVPVDLSWASDFERDVLEAARRIPYGETRAYRWLAREARRPLAIRAAASVMARNPLWLLVPCHRVIHADGTLGSYGNGAAGLARKRALLEREGVKLAARRKPEKRSAARARNKRR